MEEILSTLTIAAALALLIGVVILVQVSIGFVLRRSFKAIVSRLAALRRPDIANSSVAGSRQPDSIGRHRLRPVPARRGPRDG
jgi:hypothetical protein